MFLKSFLKVELSNINHYCDFVLWLMPLFIEQAIVYSLWCSPRALIEGNQLHSQQCCQHVHSGLLTGKESLSMEWEFVAQIKPQFKHLPTFPTSMQVYCIFYRCMLISPSPKSGKFEFEYGEIPLSFFFMSDEKKPQLV